jgi:putative endonuclease
MSGEELRIYELARAAQTKAIGKRRRRTARPPREKIPGLQIRQSARQRAGSQAEAQAGRFLEAAGLRVLEQNLRGKTGEIDLVCRDRDILAFIEVRQRRSHRYGGAAASVNLSKQERLIKTARYFLPNLTRRHFGGITPPCRFDVVTLGPNGLAWLKHAFTAD